MFTCGYAYRKKQQLYTTATLEALVMSNYTPQHQKNP